MVEECECCFHLEIFELDEACFAVNFLNCFDEFFDELCVLWAADSWMAPAVVEWICEDFLAVCTHIELDWECHVWWDLADECVEHELADWDTKARCTKVTKAEDTATICNDDAADVLAWVVAEDVLDLAGVFWCDVDASV